MPVPTVHIRRATAVMDTFLHLELLGYHPARLHRAADRAFRLAHRLAKQLSFHDPASELSRLNAAPPGRTFKTSARLRRVIAAALRIRDASDRAFNPEYLRHRRRQSRIDLGAIAKGFIVDEVVRLLRRGGAFGGLANAGGDIRAFGDREWSIELRHPIAPGRIAGRFRLRNAALCVSANTFRPGHLRNPRSGRCAATRVATAAVIARTAMVADAWATALFVGGRAGLAAWFPGRQRQALLLEKSPEGGLIAQWTQDFPWMPSTTA